MNESNEEGETSLKTSPLWGHHIKAIMVDLHSIHRGSNPRDSTKNIFIFMKGNVHKAVLRLFLC